MAYQTQTSAAATTVTGSKSAQIRRCSYIAIVISLTKAYNLSMNRWNIYKCIHRFVCVKNCLFNVWCSSCIKDLFPSNQTACCKTGCGRSSYQSNNDGGEVDGINVKLPSSEVPTSCQSWGWQFWVYVDHQRTPFSLWLRQPQWLWALPLLLWASGGEVVIRRLVLSRAFEPFTSYIIES